MIIMLEGPDLAGKTTLANRLTQHMVRGQVIHRGPPTTSNVFDEYLKPLALMSSYHQDAVLDRWHWGERIYGPILRGKDMFDDVSFEYLEMARQRYGVVSVLLCPSYTTLMLRRKGRDEDLVSMGQLRDVHCLYDNINELRGVQIDYIGRDEPVKLDGITSIISLATRYEMRARSLAQWPSYIGAKFPGFLFVGDKPAPTHKGDLTAFTPYNGSSGQHLMRCLQEQHFKYRVGSYGFMNANVREDLRGLWEELNEPFIIALGAAARDKLTALKLPHSHAPHPQYARRFHHKDTVSYGEMLLAAATKKEPPQWKAC